MFHGGYFSCNPPWLHIRITRWVRGTLCRSSPRPRDSGWIVLERALASWEFPRWFWSAARMENQRCMRKHIVNLLRSTFKWFLRSVISILLCQEFHFSETEKENYPPEWSHPSLRSNPVLQGSGRTGASLQSPPDQGGDFGTGLRQESMQTCSDSRRLTGPPWLQANSHVFQGFVEFVWLSLRVRSHLF